MALFNFDATKIAPQESIAPIPAGVYLAHAVDSDVVPTRSGGQMLKLTFVVLQGPCAKRRVFANINVRNASPEAERIGQSQLSALCHAVGVVNLQDTAQLHMRPVMIRVNISKDDTGQYGDRNKVTGYEAAQGGAPGAPAAAVPPRAPQPPQPPAAAYPPPAPPVAMVTAAPAAFAVPWARRA